MYRLLVKVKCTSYVLKAWGPQPVPASFEYHWTMQGLLEPPWKPSLVFLNPMNHVGTPNLTGTPCYMWEPRILLEPYEPCRNLESHWNPMNHVEIPNLIEILWTIRQPRTSLEPSELYGKLEPYWNPVNHNGNQELLEPREPRRNSCFWTVSLNHVRAPNLKEPHEP